MQSVYSTAPADRAKNWKKFIKIYWRKNGDSKDTRTCSNNANCKKKKKKNWPTSQWRTNQQPDTKEIRGSFKKFPDFLVQTFKIKLGKHAIETYRMLQTAFGAWIKDQFLIGIIDSRKAASLWGVMRGVGGVRRSIYKSWLAKGLELGLLCWGFKGVQEEIALEKASTL